MSISPVPLKETNTLMTANQYLDALKKRWPAIVALLLIGALVGLVYAATRPVLYESTSSVYVASEGGDTTSEQLQGSTYLQNQVQSYAELATKAVVLDPVIARLGLKQASGARETSTDLAKRVTADLDINTVIITVTAVDQSAERSARIANQVTASLSQVATRLSTPKSSRTPAITVSSVEQGTVPTTPSSPNVPFLVLTGLGVGLLLGLLYAFGRQILDTRISSDDDVRSTAGLTTVPFLGSIAHRRGRNRAANVLLADPHGNGAEEYRRLVMNLEFAGIDERIRAVTVTSALSGDGKSTTSLNLAAAAAERAQRVLLVDADLRRPSIAEYLGIDGAVGLTDVLLGTVSAGDAIQRVGDVDVLPAGTLPPNVTQLVTSDAMRRMFAELIARYDFVVVDAPPLLPVIDSLTFAQLTDGAIVVARQRVTRRKQFAQAVESLQQVEAKIVGVVLNDVNRAESSGYGYRATNTARPAAAPGTRAPETFFSDDAQPPREPAPTLASR